MRGPLAAVILLSIAFVQSALAQDSAAPTAGQQTAPVGGVQAPTTNVAAPTSEPNLAGATAPGAGAAAPSAGEPSISIAELPQDLSPWGMFLHADTIVKAVMIGLPSARW